MDAKTAYDKGWNASKRTTTYDLSAAEARFESRYGMTFSDEFTAGWVDFASDYDKYQSKPELARG